MRLPRRRSDTVLRRLAGRLVEVEALHRRAVLREPWNPEFRLNHGMSLASLGRMADAVDEALAATRLDPDAPEMWDLLRNAAREAGREDLRAEAVRQLDRLSSPER